MLINEFSVLMKLIADFHYKILSGTSVPPIKPEGQPTNRALITKADPCNLHLLNIPNKLSGKNQSSTSSFTPAI